MAGLANQDHVKCAIGQFVRVRAQISLKRTARAVVKRQLTRYIERQDT